MRLLYQFLYQLKTTQHNIREHWGSLLLSIVAVGFTMLLFASYLLLLGNLQAVSARLNEQLQIIVYLEKGYKYTTQDCSYSFFFILPSSEELISNLCLIWQHLPHLMHFCVFLQVNLVISLFLYLACNKNWLYNHQICAILFYLDSKSHSLLLFFSTILVILVLFYSSMLLILFFYQYL